MKVSGQQTMLTIEVLNDIHFSQGTTVRGASHCRRTIASLNTRWSRSPCLEAPGSTVNRSLRLALGALTITSCGGADTRPTAPEVVASILVQASAQSLVVGHTVTVTATTLGATGTPLTGRSVEWSTSAPAVATVNSAGVVTAVAPGSAAIAASTGGKSGSTTLTVVSNVASVSVTAPSSMVVRAISDVTATVKDADGGAINGLAVVLTSSDTNVVRVNASGSMLAFGAGTATITATTNGKSGVATVAVAQGAMPLRGLYVQFERRGWPSGYYPGDVLDSLTNFDAVVGQTVQAEVVAQLDAIKAMGVNTMTFELRATDAARIPSEEGFPICNTGPPLGVLYPQPETKKLNNLVTIFDLAQARGIKVFLRLVNRHFEPAYRTDSQTWLTAILDRVKTHPALDLVLFEGDAKNIDSNGDGTVDACGGQAEPPLWLGANSYGADYLQFAFQMAHSLGLPWRKISAQATVNNYNIDNQSAAGPAATDGHLWFTPGVEKTIFDRLSVPDDERTYALSFYEGTRCRLATGSACIEASAAEWSEQTMRRIWNTIGDRTRARVVAVEIGAFDPVVAGWGTAEALENAVGLIRKYGVDGGSFWRWANFQNSEDANTAIGHAIKRRGTNYTYNPVKDVLERLYKTP